MSAPFGRRFLNLYAPCGDTQWIDSLKEDSFSQFKADHLRGLAGRQEGLEFKKVIGDRLVDRLPFEHKIELGVLMSLVLLHFQALGHPNVADLRPCRLAQLDRRLMAVGPPDLIANWSMAGVTVEP